LTVYLFATNNWRALERFLMKGDTGGVVMAHKYDGDFTKRPSFFSVLISISNSLNIF
jgi:hypothetical protein